MKLDALHGKKTYFIALSAILAAWSAFFAGGLDLAGAVEATFGALIAATLRHGMKNELNALRVVPLLLALTFCGVVTSCSTTGGAAAAVNPGTVNAASYLLGVKHLKQAKNAAQWADRAATLQEVAWFMDTANAGVSAETLRAMLRERFKDEPETGALAELVLSLFMPAAGGTITPGLQNDFIAAAAKGLRDASTIAAPEFKP